MATPDGTRASLEIVIEPRRAVLTASLEVRRILPFRRRRMVGPFVFLDHGGPVSLPPERRREADVPPHPHIGLATVSYLFSGSLLHRDGIGSTQVIRPHEVNWMTAGRGIAHSERLDHPAATSEPFEMVQSWCALPDAHEEDAPAFEHVASDVLPVASERGCWLRVVAGEAYGLTSPVRVLSPLFYVHAVLDAGATLALPTAPAERAAYVVRGRVAHGGDAWDTGHLLVFARGDAVLRAETASVLLLLGGEPLGTRHIWWNFVSSRRERIEQAKDDWRSGRIVLPPDDRAEHVPLPDDGRRPRT